VQRILRGAGRGRLRLLAIVIPLASAMAAELVNVRDFGASGTGKVLDTAAVERAIAAVAAQGGGTVWFPPGEYLCGTIHLRSNVHIQLAPGAVVVASSSDKDFDPYEELPFKPVDDRETTYFRFALFAGEGVENVAISGGRIWMNRQRRGGPKPIALKNCRQVRISDLEIRDSPNYALSLLGCEFVEIDRVRILNSYADGIDPDCSRFVRITNCYVDSHDDAICPKSSQALGEPRPTENIVVANCILRTACNHFKTGTESRGAFRNIVFTNSVLLAREGDRPPISGIAIETVDGAVVENITISNIVIEGARTPIFLRLGNRGRGMEKPVPGSLRRVLISNVVARGAILASSITGIPGFRVQDVSWSDVSIVMKGGGKTRDLNVPEQENKYPEATMFGELPAWGLYVRHVENLGLHHVQFNWEQPDERPAVVLDDVLDARLQAVHVLAAPARAPLLWFHNVQGALIHSTRLAHPVPVYVRLTGAQSRDLVIAGSDLRGAGKAVAPGPEVPKGVVQVSNSPGR